MIGLLFLLLPVAAAYGWYMGQRSAQKKQQQHENKTSNQYVTGLDLLFANKSDQAVEHFIELLQDDAETIDTHLALGNLFRQRGEVDRAIRIHQSIISRESLSREQRNLAFQQLAKDYLAAGLLDRAEEILLQLLDEPESEQVALKQLLQIYQQLGEWQRAIDIARRLGPKNLKREKSLIAHFYCEQALLLEAQAAQSKAIDLLKKAIKHDSESVRAGLHLAQIYYDQAKHHSAITLLNRIPEQDPDFIPETLSCYRACCDALKEPESYQQFLNFCMQKGGGASVVVDLAEETKHQDSLSAAQNLIVEALHKNPTMRAFHQLINYYLEQAEEGQTKQSLITLKSMVGQQMQTKPRYRCQRCGFSSHTIYWHCPSCKSWGSVKPIRGIDGE